MATSPFQNRKKKPTDSPADICSRRACYALEPHTHSYGKVNVADEGRDSPEVENPAVGQVMRSSKDNSISLARVHPETDEIPTGRVILNPELEPSMLASEPAKSEDISSALCNLAIKNDSRMSSTHHIRPTPAHEADDYHGAEDWHTSLAFRPRLQAQGDGRHVGGC